MKEKEFVIITGMSGAGKSRAVEALEDIGFYCVDNMPLDFLSKFTEISMESDKMNRVALVIDIRGGQEFVRLVGEIKSLMNKGIEIKLIFLDASDDVLLRRYKETRRRHPLSNTSEGTVSELIAMEREILWPLYDFSRHIINTSATTNVELKEQIKGIFENAENTMSVSVISFGFKYGIPAESDLIFDLRCLPNPFYDVSLKAFSGLDKPVEDYVMSFAQSVEYLDKILDMADFVLPLFIKEGKATAVIAIGCTGGRHRSVCIAQKVKEHIENQGYKALMVHRDMHKGNYRS